MTEKQNQEQKQDLLQSNYDPLPPLPCYSDTLPPEVGSFVVVKCERVDDFGIFGSLPDWRVGDEAYLPIGSIVRDRGRGERRAQAAFLTRARRLCAKGQELLFIAAVEEVEAVSSTGIDQLFEDGSQVCQSFRITVTRRGITDKEEHSTLESSKHIRYFAKSIVDKVAAQVGISRLWARRVALYQPYQRSLSYLCKKVDDDEVSNEVKQVLPTNAAVHLLLNVIGKLPDHAEKEAEACLSIEGNEDCDGEGVDRVKRQEFARLLLYRCRNEQQRLAKPVLHTITSTIGGEKMIAAAAEKNAASKTVCDIAAVSHALREATSMSPPPGCDKLTVTIKGSGKYSFMTKASNDNESKALSFLESAVARAKQAWADSVATSTMEESFLKRVEGGVADQAGSKSPAMDTATCDDSPGRTFEEISQPSLNIGIIGDVANGKSTLVHAMTGKRTQAHSSEQRAHGMTIRLGFANAAILRCRDREACNAYTFLPEEYDDVGSSLPACKQCGGSLQIDKRVSFIDCPGHAELMATMLSGASAFDAVIFAAAANTPCPSPQALQHLNALKISGIGNVPVAIAQTKAELVAREAVETSSLSSSPVDRLANHASLAREGLKNTAASGAPFFPICAPLGLGLDRLAEWLGRIKAKGSIGTKQLNVLRSFDINRPGNSFEDVSGGVLGGNILGEGSFHVGDAVEIRPGLHLQDLPTKKKAKGSSKMKSVGEDVVEKDERKSKERPFAVRPLRCSVTELMSGKTSLQKASSGGLVALRTTLCPSLCADNRLVGAIVGTPGTLPPVWGPTLLMDNMHPVEVTDSKVLYKKIDTSLFLKKDVKVKCHAGSATVSGRIVRVSTKKGKIEVLLSSPLCAFRGSNVAIEAKVDDGSGNFRLVAHAQLFGGTCCIDGAEAATETMTATIPVDEPVIIKPFAKAQICVEEEDAQRLDEFIDELEEMKGQDERGKRISVPQPLVEKDGGAHVLVSNFSSIAASLRREPRHLQRYMETEASLSCAQAGDSRESLRVRWKGRGFPERLFKILRRYAITYVTCHECNGAQTELAKKDGGKTELLCRQCNARRFVTKL